MRVSGPITMLRCSASEPVFATALGDGPAVTAQYGAVVVFDVSWSEIRGSTETSISERWKWVAPNIWQVMSKKK